MGIKERAKAYAAWMMLFIIAIIFLILSVTGRLGIVTAVAFLPDNVAVINN